MRFANRSAGTHEWVEYYIVTEIVRFVKLRRKAIALRNNAPQQNASENRAEPFCPPFMQMINRAMNLFSPAFALREVREKFKIEFVSFNEAHSTHRFLR